jgi:two-component system, chemotaxis family, response regulator WspF
MRIAIANDTPLTVEAIRRVLLTQSEHEIAWVARDGEEAVLRCKRDLPDLILMDLMMPQLDGVQATRRIMTDTPCPIVVVTTSINDYSAQVFEAMGAGALDVVSLPAAGGFDSASAAKKLLAKVDTIRRLVSPTPWKKSGRSKEDDTTQILAKQERVVCIGASAGGPAALAKILGMLPRNFPASVIIVQHVDAKFAAGLANWLAGHTLLPVRLVEEGDHPRASTILIAGRDHHLVFASPHRLGYTRADKETVYRPSVDMLFKSAAAHCQGLAVGVILTGMGRDGAAGLLAMRQRGFLTIAQDEASSAVFGMPKAAIELQSATEILALDKIAPRLVNIFAQKAKP